MSNIIDVSNCMPTIDLENIYDKVDVGNIIEIKSLKATNWLNATVCKKFDRNGTYNLFIKSRNAILHLIDFKSFQDNYNKSIDYENKIRYIREYNWNSSKNICNNVQCKEKEEAILETLMKYRIIDNDFKFDSRNKITFHNKDDRSNTKKYIRIIKGEEVLGEFWYKEPQKIVSKNSNTYSWIIDLTYKYN